MPNGNVGRFQRAEYVDLTLEQLDKDFGGKVPINDLKILLAEMQQEVLYRSEYYQVAITKQPRHGFPGMLIWHLSIKRNDKEPIHDWRDLQAIKNQLCGEDVEAMEVYPAESRKVDSANQYHLWAFMKKGKERKPMVPVGWTRRFVTDDPFVNGKQRAVQTTEEKDGVFPTMDERLCRCPTCGRTHRPLPP